MAQKWTDADPQMKGGMALSLGDIASSIGIGRAREFSSFVSMIDKMPSRQEIMLDPDKCRVPEKLDERCAVVSMLSMGVDGKTFPSFSKYVQRFPVSMQILFIKLCGKRDSTDDIRKTREYAQWITVKEVKDAILDRG